MACYLVWVAVLNATLARASGELWNFTLVRFGLAEGFEMQFYFGWRRALEV